MQLFRYFVGIIFSYFFVQETIYAQDSSQVTWEIIATKTAEKKYEVTFKGSVKEGWHLYAADANEGIKGIEIVYNDSSVINETPALQIPFIEISDKVFEGASKKVATGDILIRHQLSFPGDVPPTLKATISYEVADDANFIPEEQKLPIILDTEKASRVSNRILVPSIDIKKPLTDCGASAAVASETASKGLPGLFFLGFLGGLVALLTPCVFPMIPLTVSFFTKKAVSRRAGISNAFLYGFFIFLIYILLSVPFHFLDSIKPEILNNISTNVYLNVFFFVVFIVFALSFFGFYEITLPASFSTGVDSKAGVGNIAGIFFMALTLALVSFSCTGPILGSLLAGSLTSNGGAMQLTAGMGGFGLALALPFALFALFPNWLKAMPKSGGWLTTVKIVLGFIELALALKFLSNADLVEHWGLLKREVFIGLWVVIGLGLSLYLFGKIKFPHDTPPKKVATGRLITGIIVTVFTLYLIPGLTNTKWANLKLISGFPPPLYYSIYQQDSECVLGLNCSRDYDEGLAMAKAVNKPILLDFTGYACVNCRRMEENVWSDEDVYKLMKDSFIVISLYVDDKKKLPAAQQFTYKSASGVEKEIVTVGDKWSTFETENFANNAQPLYAILNTNEQLLSHPVGYIPSAKEYLAWLQCGLHAFKKK